MGIPPVILILVSFFSYKPSSDQGGTPHFQEIQPHFFIFVPVNHRDAHLLPHQPSDGFGGFHRSLHLFRHAADPGGTTRRWDLYMVVPYSSLVALLWGNI